MVLEFTAKKRAIFKRKIFYVVKIPTNKQLNEPLISQFKQSISKRYLKAAPATKKP